MNALDEIKRALDELEAVKARLAEVETGLARAYAFCDHAYGYWTAQAGSPPRDFTSRELHDLTMGPQLTRVRDYLAPAPGERANQIFYSVVDRLGVDVANALIRQRGWSDLSAPDLWSRLRDEVEALDATLERRVRWADPGEGDVA